jgi:hypothetical protein
MRLRELQLLARFAAFANVESCAGKVAPLDWSDLDRVESITSDVSDFVVYLAQPMQLPSVESVGCRLGLDLGVVLRFVER